MEREEREEREQAELLNRQIKVFSGIYRETAGSFDISENEFWIWYALINMEESITQQDLCELWSFPKQTVNTIIANMAKRNQIVLTPVPGSRYRKNIRLTTAGRKFGEGIVASISNAERRALQRLSPQERMTCLALFAKYANCLQEEMLILQVEKQNERKN